MHVPGCHKIGNLDFVKQQDFKSNLGLAGYSDGHFIDTNTVEYNANT